MKPCNCAKPACYIKWSTVCRLLGNGSHHIAKCKIAKQVKDRAERRQQEKNKRAKLLLIDRSMSMALDYLTWWLMSPGVACFLLLNVLVAAIAVTSRSGAQQGGPAASWTRRRLCRSASSMVLDRLRSSFAKHPSVEFRCYYVSPEEEERQVSRAAPDHQLAVPEPVAVADISMSTGEDETAAGVVSSDGTRTCVLGQEGRHAQESMPSSTTPAAPAVAMVTAETDRVPSSTRPPEKKPVTVTVVPEFVKRKHRDHVYAVEGKAELNARAEQFIRQFRQELQLQRLDSMLSRHTHTLCTSSSGAPTSR